MAIVGMEGFDYFETGQKAYGEINEKENYTLSDPSEPKCFIQDTNSRFGLGKYLRISKPVKFIVNVASTTITDTIIMGFAISPRNKVEGTNFLYIYNANDTACVRLKITNSGTIRAINAAGTILGTSTQSMTLNNWYWIDLKIVMSSTVGIVELEVDGVNWLNITGADTKFDSLTDITSFALYGDKTNFSFDDVVWMDEDGDDGIGGFVTDSRIETLLPTGDSSGPWSTSEAGSDASHVEEITEGATDVDDKYIYTNTNVEELFTYDSISSASVVRALSIVYRARRDDVQSRAVTSTHSKTSSPGTTRALGTSYLWYSDVFQYSDTGTTAWTQTSIDGTTFGVEDVTP